MLGCIKTLPVHVPTHSHHVRFAPSLADLQTVRVTDIVVLYSNAYVLPRALVPLNYGDALWSVLPLFVDILSLF